jgi:hypothetical protein
VVLLDRGVGFARDTSEPAASIARLVAQARALGSTRRRAESALALIERAQRIRRALCVEAGAPRVRVGGEHRFDVGAYGITARAGFSYETSATPAAYTSVLTFDADKATVSLGASLARGRFRLDAVYAHTFWGSVETTPCAYDPRAPTRCQGLYPTAPFRAGPNAPRYTVNGGSHDPTLNVFGLGLRYAF